MDFRVEMMGDVAVVKLPCEYLDAGNYESFVSQVDELLGNHQRVIMDFSRVQFIDSSGIGTILFAQRKITGGGGVLGVCCVRPSLHEDLRRLQIHRLLDLHDTLEEAIEAISK